MKSSSAKIILTSLLMFQLAIIFSQNRTQEYYVSNCGVYLEIFNNRNTLINAPEWITEHKSIDGSCSPPIFNLTEYNCTSEIVNDTLLLIDPSNYPLFAFVKLDSITLKFLYQQVIDTVHYPHETILRTDTINLWLCGETLKLAKEYYKNGELKVERKFRLYKRPTLLYFSKFIPFGRRIKFDTYNQLVPHGIWKYYDSKGELINKVKYKKGIKTNANKRS